MQPDKNLYRRIAIRSALILFSAALVLTVGVRLFWLLLPFFLAYFFAWILNPVVGAICRKTRLPHRAVSMAIVILAFLLAAAILVWLIWLAVSEASRLADGWQELIAGFERIVSRIREGVVLPFGGVLHENVDELLVAARETLSGLMEPLSDQLLSLATGAAKMLPTALLFVIALVMGTCFILSDFDALHRKVDHALRAEGFRPVLRVLDVLRHVFGGYLMTAFALAMMVALINLAGLLLLRVEYATLLSLVMGVLDFLPYVGSGAILIPWSVACFYTGDWLRGLYLVLLYAILFLARNVAGRRLLGAKFRRSPFLALVFAFIGWKLWGLPGLILGPVLCMIGVNLFSSGLLDRTVADFRLLFSDLRTRLGGGAPDQAAPKESAHNAQETQENDL